MSKTEFINILKSALNGISENERSEIIYDYEEHFDVGIEEGKTEEEISSALGDPKAIAKQFKVDYLIKIAEKDKSTGNLVSAVFASVGLGFLNLILLPFFLTAAAIVFSLLAAAASVIISILAAIFSIVISIYATAIGLTLGGAAEFIAIIIAPFLPQYVSMEMNVVSAILLSIGCISLGILIFIGAVKLSKITINWVKIGLIQSYKGAKKCVKGFYLWILKYLRLNVNMVTKREVM